MTRFFGETPFDVPLLLAYNVTIVVVEGVCC